MFFTVKDFKQSKKGFTLLELILVMSVIGVLATTIIIVYPNYAKRARDTQRISDLKQYQTLLERFANTNNSLYPDRSGGDGNGMNNLCSDLGISSSCVQDPKNGESLCNGNTCRYYIRTNSCGSGGDACATFYVLFAPLEAPQNYGYYWGTCSSGESGEFFSSSLPGDLDGASSCPI